jgi:hypothetical protein
LTSRRGALLTFVAVEAATVVIVVVSARHQWFTADEWDFLGARRATSLYDLFRPHNGHLSTLPILVYRARFAVVGLRSYLPYQLAAVGTHLTTAALLRVVMRRADVRPWFATAAASLFALFGAGHQNIIWGFQIGFVGALAFGLVQLLLADHDAPFSLRDRRDWLALGAGLLGLLCSGVAVTMVLAVALATFLRRGYRAALFQVAPLGVLYLVWYATIGRKNTPPDSSAGGRYGAVVHWAWTQLSASLGALGDLPGIGIALAIALVFGCWLAWHRLTRAEFGAVAAAPLALAVAAGVFAVTVGWQRVALYPVELARSSRYLYVTAALLLPAITVGVEAISARWRFAVPVGLALLLIGIPGNIATFWNPSGLYSSAFQVRYRTGWLAFAQLPAARQVPRTLRPDRMLNVFRPGFQHEVDLGWVFEQKRANKLPSVHLRTALRTETTVRLALHQSSGVLFGASCRPLTGRVSRHLTPGEVVGFRGAVRIPKVRYAGEWRTPAHPVTFDERDGDTLTTLIGPLDVQFASAKPRPVSVQEKVPSVHAPQLCSAFDARGRADLLMGLLLQQSQVPSTRPQCRTLRTPTTRDLRAGDTFDIKGGPLGITAHVAGVASHVKTYDPAAGNRIGARGALHVTLRSADPDRPVSVCD